MPRYVITQRALKQYYEAREARLNFEASQRANSVLEDKLKDTIMNALLLNESIQPGPLSASLTNGPRRPSWKNHFLHYCGSAEAEKIILATPPSIELRVLYVPSTSTLKVS